MVGALSIVVASAAASAALAFNELDKLTAAFSQGPTLDIDDQLALAEPGQPQTIMLLGSDKRANSPQTEPGEYGDPRSDTVILVRLDPEREALALMSLPRDLQVELPGRRGNGFKLNDAYSYGGPRLTVETVRQLTGLTINHVVDIGFGGFSEAVDEVGCVWTDVDRDYFSDGIEFAYVNINPGYQKLCGDDALGYVRSRYGDTDIVRSARQQEFLRQAKDQFTPSEIAGNRNELLDIFGDNTDSDIDSTEETLTLLKLAYDLVDAPVHEVHFQGEVGQRVIASDAEIDKMVSEFLGVEDTAGPRGVSSGDGGGSDGAADREDVEKEQGAELVDSSAAGQDQAERAQNEDPGLPIFYPTRTTPGSEYSVPPTVYDMEVEEDEARREEDAYRLVLHSGLVGEYYGLQGTTWQNPPILEEPTETRTIDGREYELHFDGDRLRLVAWRTSRGVYWISNTLLQSLSEDEMLGVAASAREL